jgi:hypothetical protein
VFTGFSQTAANAQPTTGTQSVNSTDSLVTEQYTPLTLKPSSVSEFETSRTRVLSDSASTDQEWAIAAAEVAREKRNLPDVEITAYGSSESQIAFRYKVNRQEAGLQAALPLAVPTGNFKKATYTPVTGDEITSSPAVSFEELGWIRNSRIGRVTLPSLPNSNSGDSGEIHLYFDHSKTTTETASTFLRENSHGIFRDLLTRFVANPQDIDTFQQSDASAIPGPPVFTTWRPGFTVKSPFWIKMQITDTGVYRFSGADLKKAGVNTGALPRNALHLLLNGTEQPLLRTDAVATRSESMPIASDDIFMFFGTGNSSVFSTRNSYWLYADTSHPRTDFQTELADAATTLVEPATTFPGKLLLEEDRQVLTKNDQFLTIKDSRWIWQKLTTDTQFTRPFDMPVMAPMQRDLPAKLKLYIVAPGEKLSLRVKINDFSPEPLLITSNHADELNFRIPMSALHPTSNTLRVQLEQGLTTASAVAAREQPEIYFDSFELDYPKTYSLAELPFRFSSPSTALAPGEEPNTRSRNVDYRIAGIPADARFALFQITNPVSPILVKASLKPSRRFREPSELAFRAFEDTSNQYILSSAQAATTVALSLVAPEPDLLSSENSGDYIIIAYRDFIPAIKEFAEWKKTQGYSPRIVDVEHIYDQFSYGQETPEAIKSFLRLAATSWRGSKNNTAASFVLHVGDCTSAYRNQFRNNVVNYVPSYTVGSADRFASDNWFATFCGDDLLADSLIGRFSVNSTGDLENLLKKQYIYRARPGRGPWVNTLGFVADHSEFESALQQVMTQSVPSRFFVKRILMAEEPWVDNYYFPSEIADAKRAKVSPATTRKIRDLFDSGAAIITYFGHGSPNVWSNERIWFGGDSENSDNLMLNNTDRLPLVMTMTCNTGAIDYPMPRWNVTISEDMMRIANGGAIACYVPSGPGITAQHERYTLNINRALLRENVKPLQAALTLGTWRYLLEKQPTELAKMFILLGDPTLDLVLPDFADYSPLKKATISDREIRVPLPGAASESGGYYQVSAEAPDFFATDVQPFKKGEAELAIPDFETGQHEAFHVSIMADPHNRDGSRSFFRPVQLGSDIRVRSAARTTPGAVFPGQQINYAIQIRNGSELPIRAGRLLLLNSQGDTCDSTEFTLLPEEQTSATLSLEAKPGINKPQIAQIVRGTTQTLQLPENSDLTFATVATAAASAPRAVLDSGSVHVQYYGETRSPVAAVSVRVYNQLPGSLTDAEISLADSLGKPQATAPIPPILPGSNASVLLRTDLTSATSSRFSLCVDRGLPNASSEVPITLSRQDLPDLAIEPNGIKVSTTSPTDGETIFFDIEVRNSGNSRADYVRVDGFDGVGSTSQKIESRIPAVSSIPSLGAGESHLFHLRWDPFRNAGQHQLLFRVESDGSSAELNPADNVQILPLKVLTKYDLHPAGIEPRVTPEDIRKRQIELIAKIENRGESPAHGVKVVFWPTPDRRDPSASIGEAVIDEIPAKSVGKALLIYKLKPGEESRSFQPSYRAFLKGSLQRIASPGLD